MMSNWSENFLRQTSKLAARLLKYIVYAIICLSCVKYLIKEIVMTKCWKIE